MTRTERQLHDLLEQERIALLAGDYASLALIAKNKSALVESIEPTSANLRLLSAKVIRNQRLTAAAKSAIDSVIHRLNTAQKSQQGFSSYARDGSRQMIAAESKAKLNSSI